MDEFFVFFDEYVDVVILEVKFVKVFDKLEIVF